MKRTFQIFILLNSVIAISQNSMSELLKKYNNRSIPYISVHELAMPKTKAVILDARELGEYSVSHIKDAIHVGYSDFQIESIENKIQDKSSKIVVYCSLGIRSEDIAEKLKSYGFTDVSNLYGGIFEWKNYGFPVYDSYNLETENIHVFSEEWSYWLKKGNKIYE